MKSLIYASCAAILLVGSAAHSQDVTACGQTVSNGVLTGNLDCSAETGCAVVVLDRGSLDLAGFTLTVGADCGVGCEDDCSLIGGGGTIDAVDALSGINSQGHNARIHVSDVNIVGGNYGVIGARVTVVDSSVTLASNAVRGLRSLEVRGSEIIDNNEGMNSTRHVTVEDSTVTGNVRGIVSQRKATLLNATVTDNDYVGVSARKVHATTTTITGNGSDLGCTIESYGCVDLLSRQNPKLSTVTCETSGKLDKDGNPAADTTWGVCTLD